MTNPRALVDINSSSLLEVVSEGAGARGPVTKRSNEEILAAYEKHKSVWKAAAELGMRGQTVHSRLHRMGRPPTPIRHLTQREMARIKEYYTATPPELFNLDVLASEINRTRNLICRYAKEIGLTDQGRRSSERDRAVLKESLRDKWKRYPHPRGFLGSTHSEAARKIISEKSRRAWATMKTFRTGNMSDEALRQRSARQSAFMAGRPASKVFTRARGGRRDDLGATWFRSSWEANYARYLNLLMRLGVVEKWEFEPHTFWFSGVRRGTNSYKPDFRVFYKNDPVPEYVELKGWVVAKDKTKWRRMAKYHPEIKLTIIRAKEYYSIQRKWSSSIPNWESDKGGGRKLGPRSGVRVTITPA